MSSAITAQVAVNSIVSDFLCSLRVITTIMLALRLGLIGSLGSKCFDHSVAFRLMLGAPTAARGQPPAF